LQRPQMREKKYGDAVWRTLSYAFSILHSLIYILKFQEKRVY
jgi:hypothetical protein